MVTGHPVLLQLGDLVVLVGPGHEEGDRQDQEGHQAQGHQDLPQPADVDRGDAGPPEGAYPVVGGFGGLGAGALDLGVGCDPGMVLEEPSQGPSSQAAAAKRAGRPSSSHARNTGVTVRKPQPCMLPQSKSEAPGRSGLLLNRCSRLLSTGAAGEGPIASSIAREERTECLLP